MCQSDSSKQDGGSRPPPKRGFSLERRRLRDVISVPKGQLAISETGHHDLRREHRLNSDAWQPLYLPTGVTEAAVRYLPWQRVLGLLSTLCHHDALHNHLMRLSWETRLR